MRLRVRLRSLGAPELPPFALSPMAGAVWFALRHPALRWPGIAPAGNGSAASR